MSARLVFAVLLLIAAAACAAPQVVPNSVTPSASTTTLPGPGPTIPPTAEGMGAITGMLSYPTGALPAMR
ncbi:MAG TPA: hypothetical protein VIV15_03675, partial [Anaerolineales bacterium]